MAEVVCRVCGERFASDEERDRHVLERHPDEGPGEREVAHALGLSDEDIAAAGIDEGTGQSVDGTGTGTDSEVEE